MLYSIEVKGNMLKIGFGDEKGDNAEIVSEVKNKINEMIRSGELSGGPILKINGPASLPVAFVLAHAVLHRFAAIGVWDPKIGAYVIVANHGGPYEVGDLIE